MRRTETYDFNSTRAAEERAKADVAPDEARRQVHLEMAKIFEERAKAAERNAQALRRG